jgi:hypothetical protein
MMILIEREIKMTDLGGFVQGALGHGLGQLRLELGNDAGRLILSNE